MRHARSALRLSLFLSFALVAVSCRGFFDSTTSPLGGGHGPSFTFGSAGGVYTMTNAAGGNAIVAFSHGGNHGSDSTLTPLGSFPTGGAGTGGAIDPLRSQNSLILDPRHRFLFAVDAGSNEITSFRVNSDATLTLADHVASGGNLPVSLAFSSGLLYVLNAGDNRIEAFRVGTNGSLDSLGGTSLAPGAAGASTIGVSGDGRSVIVTERDANRLELLGVRRNGTLESPTVTPSSGAVPFGFATTATGAVVVTEAQGALPDGAVSSYRVASGRNLLAGFGGGGGGGTDSLKAITASLDAGGLATCWVVAARTGTAYVVNSGSAAIATVRVSGAGALTRIDATAIQFPAASAPIDLDLATGDRLLYVLEAGTGDIAVIDSRGGTPQLLNAVPAGAGASGMQGLAAW
jgi:6-phosphogluconolactonase